MNKQPDSHSERQVRRSFSGAEKVAILKRHLLDKVPISTLCDELRLYPNQFYGWLKEFFENGHVAFDNGRKSKAVEDAQQRRIDELQAKLHKKNEVMAELMEALTEEKKEMGNSKSPLGSPRHPRPDCRFRPLLE